MEAELTRPPIKVDEGLVALWTFDKDLSESVSKNESHSALPTKLVDGKLNKGLLLSDLNTSNEIVADGEGPVDLNGPFTLSFWARWENEDGVLIAQAGKRARLMIKLFDGHLEIKHDRPALTMRCNVRRDLPLKTWRHITITYDGSPNANGLEVFLDGKKRDDAYHNGLLPEGGRPPAPIDASQTQMHFGCNPFAERPQFGCQAIIDEVRVYNRQLSADEIKQVNSYGME